MTTSECLVLVEIDCAFIETAIRTLKGQNLTAEQKKQLHALVCRFETIATRLRAFEASNST